MRAEAEHLGHAFQGAGGVKDGGPVGLVQEIFADDYRGTTVTFPGKFRGPGTTGRTGLFVRVMTPPVIHGPFTAEAALADPSNHIVSIASHADWREERDGDAG
jgi:hypothetical protein